MADKKGSPAYTILAPATNVMPFGSNSKTNPKSATALYAKLSFLKVSQEFKYSLMGNYFYKNIPADD